MPAFAQGLWAERDVAMASSTSMGLGAEEWCGALVARATAASAARRGLVARGRRYGSRWAKLGIKIASRARAAAPQLSCGARLCDVCVYASGFRLFTHRLKGLPPAPVRFIRSLSVKIDLPSPATSLSKRPGQMWSL